MSETEPTEYVVEFQTSWVFDPAEWDDMTPELAASLACDALLNGDFNPQDGVFLVNKEAVEP